MNTSKGLVDLDVTWANLCLALQGLSFGITCMFPGLMKYTLAMEGVNEMPWKSLIGIQNLLIPHLFYNYDLSDLCLVHSIGQFFLFFLKSAIL